MALKNFNESLNDWNVSNVQSMEGMFSGCTSFNQPLNNWNVSKVQTMQDMFYKCSSFNQPLNKWNISNVTDMKGMFYKCTSFNQPLNKWDVSNVIYMEDMFYGCTSFNQPLNNWYILDNIDIQNMFFNSRMSLENFPNQGIPEIASKIKVFDIIEGIDISSIKFIEDNYEYKPFIIRTKDKLYSSNLYSGEAILWPAPSENGKEFIECKDDAPLSWQGYNYGQYIKPDARTFIKMTVNGSTTMVLKPEWYDSNIVPGTKFFNLINTNKPVFKFLSSVLADVNRANAVSFNAVGSDHCNQTSPVGVYKLEPITIEQLKHYIIQDEREKIVKQAASVAKTRKHKTKTTSKTKKEAIGEPDAKARIQYLNSLHLFTFQTPNI